MTKIQTLVIGLIFLLIGVQLIGLVEFVINGTSHSKDYALSFNFYERLAIAALIAGPFIFSAIFKKEKK